MGGSNQILRHVSLGDHQEYYTYISIAYSKAHTAPSSPKKLVARKIFIKSLWENTFHMQCHQYCLLLLVAIQCTPFSVVLVGLGALCFGTIHILDLTHTKWSSLSHSITMLTKASSTGSCIESKFAGSLGPGLLLTFFTNSGAAMSLCLLGRCLCNFYWVISRVTSGSQKSKQIIWQQVEDFDPC